MQKKRKKKKKKKKKEKKRKEKKGKELVPLQEFQWAQQIALSFSSFSWAFHLTQLAPPLQVPKLPHSPPSYATQYIVYCMIFIIIL